MPKMRVEKHWQHEGYECVVVMNEHMGFRCGYVGIPKGHPLYGKPYNEDCPELKGMIGEHTTIGKRGALTVFCWDGKSTDPQIVFDVHGGLTYSGEAGYPIDKPDTWWFGYDCGHAGDMTNYTVHDGDVMRDLDYCVGECESLAEQLKDTDRVKKEG